MNPRKERNIVLALALAEADSATFETVWSLVFGTKTQWHGLLEKAAVSVNGFSEERFPLEKSPTSNGVNEVPFPMECKNGKDAVSKMVSVHNFVGPGSALLYIATRESKCLKLVISGCTWNGEDGHTYVAVYDRLSSSIYLELIDELDSSYTFLVR